MLDSRLRATMLLMAARVLAGSMGAISCGGMADDTAITLQL
jgi:hypothetical protein